MENETGGQDTDRDLEDRDDQDRKTETQDRQTREEEERGASVMLMLCTSGLIALDGR